MPNKHVSNITAGTGISVVLAAIGESEQVAVITNTMGATIADVTASAAEINILDGATVTATELNALSGLTTATTLEAQLIAIRDRLDALENP